VDVFRSDVLSQLRGCHGFLWRHRHVPRDRAVSVRLLPALEHQLGLPVYPDQSTCWHYDDKIAQAYLLEAAGIPIPRTWVFWTLEEALAFCARADYPLVLKLHAGASSHNVTRVDDRASAERWAGRMFGAGARGVGPDFGEAPLAPAERVRTAARILRRGRMPDVAQDRPLHHGYLLLQEFLPDNAYETRVMVIGERAFGRLRRNGDGDWRASGYGRTDPDPKGVDPAAVRLAFAVARRLGTQSLAVDMLRRGEDFVVSEISYCYSSWKVHICPGHWTLEGGPDEGGLRWHEGPMWGEAAQLEDFLARLETRYGG
jgi:hypothetical protein